MVKYFDRVNSILIGEVWLHSYWYQLHELVTHQANIFFLHNF